MKPNPSQIVREGYNKVSREYRADDDAKSVAHYTDLIQGLLPLVSEGDHILDLGCGCGEPVARMLSEDGRVVGVDLSEVQLRRARALVPKAALIQADIGTLHFTSTSFAAVVAFYSLIHVPMEQQFPLLQRIHGWLQPGGHFLATLGHHAWTGTEVDWLEVPGATMYWSHADGKCYRQWLERVGFTILESRFVPEGDSGFTLFLCEK